MNKTSSLSGNPGTDTAGEALTPKSGGTDGNVLDQKIRNLNQRTNHLLARIEKDIQPAVKLQHRDAHETDLKIPEDKISERAKKAVKRAIKVNTDGPKPLTVKQIWHKLLELFDRVFGNRKTKVVYRLRDAIKRQDIGGIDELLKKEEDVRCKLCDYIRDDEKLLLAMQDCPDENIQKLAKILELPNPGEEPETPDELEEPPPGSAAAQSSVQVPASNPSGPTPPAPGAPQAPASTPTAQPAAVQPAAVQPAAGPAPAPNPVSNPPGQAAAQSSVQASALRPPAPAKSAPAAAAPGTSGATRARALRSGETLLTLATFLTDCNRRDQDMLGDGWCGFYAILSQTGIDARFAGNALETWNGAQGAQEAVRQLQKALGYRPGSINIENWLDTERLQRVAQHTGRAVVAIDTRGSLNVKQIDFAIPNAGVVLAAGPKDFNTNFSVWLSGFLTEKGIDQKLVIDEIKQHIAQTDVNVDVDNFTVLEVIRGLLINPQTIGLSHPTENHFHALQPPAVQPPAGPAPAPNPASNPSDQRPPAPTVQPAAVQPPAGPAPAPAAFDAAAEANRLEQLKAEKKFQDFIDGVRALDTGQLGAVLREKPALLEKDVSLNEILQIIERKDPDFRAVILRAITIGVIRSVLERDSYAHVVDILGDMGWDNLAEILKFLPKMVEILRQLPREKLAQITPDQREALLEGLIRKQTIKMKVEKLLDTAAANQPPVKP